MNFIVAKQSRTFLEPSIPAAWKDNVTCVHPNDITSPIDVVNGHYYVANDISYDAVCRYGDISKDPSFTSELILLANHKYESRQVLTTMQDMPFTLSNDNHVNWPFDVNDALLAKLMTGASSRDVVKTRHADVLPDIGEDYIIEKYIDDKYQRIRVWGGHRHTSDMRQHVPP